MQENIKSYSMKRLSVVCVIFLLFLLMPVISLADKQGTCDSGDFYYRELDDGTVELTEFDPAFDCDEIDLPSMVNGKVVSSIDGTTGWKRWCWWGYHTNCVSIPESITTIKGNPFFTEYTSAYDYIGEFRVPSEHPTLEVINGCLIDKRQKKLIAASEDYTGIPDGIEILGEYCNVPLYDINIPNSVSVIEQGAFAYSFVPSSREITIPNSVTQMSGNPFMHVGRIKINIEKDHPILEIVKGVLYDKTEPRLIHLVEKTNNIVIRPGTEIIEAGAFQGEQAFSIELPDSIRSIGEYAFSSGKLKEINIPCSVKTIGEFAFAFCWDLEKVVIQSGATEIGVRTFCDCKKLKSIIIPDSVTKIGYEAFENCKELRSIIIPDSVTDIEDSAFQGCKQLKEVIIGKGINSIGGGGFNIKPNVELVFWGCNNVEALTLTGSIKRWKFSDEFKAKIKTVTLGEGTTEIERDAFRRFEKLEKVSLPDSVTVIGERAFDGLKKLKTVNLPNGLKEISGEEAFHNCEALESISIPGSLYKIPASTFADCKKLKTVIIEDGVRIIEKAAFKNCTSIESITIPGSVQYIGENAFEGCKKLKQVIIEDGLEKIKKNAFKDCHNLKTITIPQSVKSIEAVFDRKKIKMIVYHDSFAERFCKNYEISYSYAD